tara:strand:- start:40 stop:459 length:420 start_codon:yes stop_codon:yes gene_type:complete
MQSRCMGFGSRPLRAKRNAKRNAEAELPLLRRMWPIMPSRPSTVLVVWTLWIACAAASAAAGSSSHATAEIERKLRQAHALEKAAAPWEWRGTSAEMALLAAIVLMTVMCMLPPPGKAQRGSIDATRPDSRRLHPRGFA